MYEIVAYVKNIFILVQVKMLWRLPNPTVYW